jgi:adenosylhomocysteine nucleosidase
VFTQFPQVLCSTADSFVTHRHDIAGDVVDMEAFALARACLAENARFACVKYITDGADSDSATHWETALDNAARTFLTVFESLDNVE